MSTDNAFKFRLTFEFTLTVVLPDAFVAVLNFSTEDMCTYTGKGKTKKKMFDIMVVLLCMYKNIKIYNALFTSHPCEVPIPCLPIGPFGFHSQRALQAAVGATSVYIHYTVIETGFVSDKFLAFISLVVYLLPPLSSMADDAPCF